MAALIGSESKIIQQLINEKNIKLEIANDNSPIQIVVSGDIDEIKKNKDIFLNNGIKKYVILNVSAAFHSKYMIDAQRELSKDIENIKFTSNSTKIISNFTADVSDDNLIIKNSLQKQMANMVRWTESIKKLEEIGENKIIEIGPNKILSSLIKRISNNFDIKSINKIADLV